MADDIPFSDQISAAIEGLRAELAERVAVLKALQEISDAAKSQEDAGWRITCIEDLINNAENEMTRAGLVSAFNTITQNIDASA